MWKHSKLLFAWFVRSFFPRVRHSVVPLLCAVMLLFSADCSLTTSDLRWSHPDIPIVPICDKPLDVADDVNLWGFNFATKELVTAEDPLELRLFDSADMFFEYQPDAPLSSASKMPPEYGLTCKKPAMAFPDASALFFKPSSELFRSKDDCPAKVGQADARAAPQFVAVVPGAKPPSKKKDPQRVRVCVRPPGVEGNVDEWAPRDVKGNLLTKSEKAFLEAAANADVIFVFDSFAPPESVYWFVTDHTKLSCPGKPPPKPYKDVVGTGLLPMLDAVTSIQAACNPKQGDGQTSWTSDPNGKGPPLTGVQVFARNLAILAALASSDTSGDLKDPNGKRYGIPSGKNPDGPDSMVLQAGVSVLAIIGLPVKSGKEYIQQVIRAISERKAPTILDPKVLSKEIAEELAKEPTEKQVRDAIDGLAQGNTKPFDALESFGKAMAPSLREAGAILPYSRARIFTRGWEGKFQAHHALEVDMAEDVFGMTKGEIDDIPAIILSDAEHNVVTKNLDAARGKVLDRLKREGKGEEMSPGDLWQVYKEAYAGHQPWLDAIYPYFVKASFQ